MGRYIITTVWSVIYMLVASFNGTDLRNCVIVGIIFGILFSAIIATITARSHKDNSKYSKLK